MLLALNIGNTHTGVALLDGPEIVGDTRLATMGPDPAAALNSAVSQLTKSFPEPDGVAFCSVVPAMTPIVRDFHKTAFGSKQLLEISKDLSLGIRNSYHTPDTLGTDRICNAVAGYKLYGLPQKANVIVIDFGTATTYDVVTADGEYVGGLIAPGIRTAAEGMLGRTAQLPDVDLSFPETVIGKSTRECIRAGILFSALASTEGIVGRIQKRLQGKTLVVAAGGLSDLLSKQTRLIDRQDRWITYRGLQLLFEMNRR